MSLSDELKSDLRDYIKTANDALISHTKDDVVNHPPHYNSSSGLEVIDVIDAFTEDLWGMEAVCTANVIKYICRWKRKNGVEDLKKARWYLNKLIDIKSGKGE